MDSQIPPYSNDGRQIEVEQKNVTVPLSAATNNEPIYAPGTTTLTWTLEGLDVVEAKLQSRLDTDKLEILSDVHPISIRIKDGVEENSMLPVYIGAAVRGSNQAVQVYNLIHVVPDPSEFDSQD